MNREVHTVIIGSGISGLSFAHFLSKSDKDFLVLESQSRVGGIIHTETKNHFICENGPNTVLLNNDAIVELIEDCGLWDQLKYPRDIADKNRFVLHKGKLTKVPTSLLKFICTPLLSLRGKARVLRDLFANKHTEDTTVYDFISDRFGVEFHDQLIEPFVTGVYAGNTREMSVQHSLKLLWDLEQKHGGVIKGFFKRKKNKRVKGSFHLPIGLSQLTDKMAENLGNKVKLNCAVRKITKNSDGYEINTGKGSIFCKQLVSTIPAHVLKYLISDQPFRDVLDKVNYSPVDVFHFGFKKESIKNKDQGFGVLTKPSDSKTYLGVLFSSRTFGHVAPAGCELFTVIAGGERQRELCDLPIEDLERIILSDLEELLHHKGEVVLKNHFRWKNGIPQYDMNHQELIDGLVQFEKRNQDFYVLGNFHGGVSVSDCINKSKKLALKLTE
tara:strand:- start:4353 stop:5678 length:1326 start_codon:yes stop_codon:yes gene_type:complete